MFSSHVVSVLSQLSDYMKSPSERPVALKKLPDARNLQQAKHLLDFPDLTPHKAIYLGLIPALYYGSKLNRLPYTRRSEATAKYLDSGLTDALVRQLLSTMLDGNIKNVPAVLSELMDIDIAVDQNGNAEGYARWIPYHMVYVLENVSTRTSLSQPIRKCLKAICAQFETLASHKVNSGDGWEALFIATLLVRCMTGEFCQQLVPLRGSFDKVLWNEPFRDDSNFETQHVEEFVQAIPYQQEKSGISIYYPTHAQFEVYDVILAYWGDDHKRRLFGYQLKEGKDIPKKFAVAGVFDKSYLIRGKAASVDQSIRLYTTPSDTALDNFFGKSAMHWTPKAWAELRKSDATTPNGSNGTAEKSR